MVHLAEDLGAMGVHGVDKLNIARNLLVVVKTGDARIALAALLHGVVFGDEQTPAALGLLFHVLDVALGDDAVERAIVGHHRRHHQTVRHLARTDLKRAEQCIEFHEVVPSSCGEGLSPALQYVDAQRGGYPQVKQHGRVFQ